jgi:putative ABC transport system permease protein
MGTAWLSDLRLALRTLRKTPAFTLLVLAILALGIGFNAASYSLVRALLVRPLALPEVDRLVMVEDRGPQDPEVERLVSAPAWRRWQAEARSFEGLAAGQFLEGALSGAAGAEPVIGYRVSPEFFPVMRTPPALGRALGTGDGATVVLGDGVWRRLFGADPQVLGRVVKVDGVSRTVVGVMPRSFRYPAGVELWIPLVLDPVERTDPRQRTLWVMGRLRPGVGLAEASAELATIAGRQDRQPIASHLVRAVPLARTVTDNAGRAFTSMLMTASVFVLLIVCANIAGLVLARGLARRRELAVRAALGAGRRRLVQLLLAEGAVLALGAAGLSLLVAVWSIAAIKAAVPGALTRFMPGWDGMAVDQGVLLVTLGLAVATALLFGLAPALRLSRVSIAEVLKDGGAAVAGGRRGRTVLVTLQVAVALVLLVGTAATAAGFVRAADPRQGLDPDGVLGMKVTLAERRYDTPAAVLQLQRRAVAALRALPGVTGAAAASNVPWGEWGAGRDVTAEGGPAAELDFRAVSPDYLDVLRIPLRAGRGLTAADDRPDGEPVAVISESAAARLWPDRDAVGRHLTMGGRRWRVLGVAADVVADARHRTFRTPFPTLYVPYGVVAAVLPSMYIVIRTTGDPQALADPARAALARVDGELPLSEVQTFAERLGERLSGVRLGAIMMAVLAAVALLLAAIGVYGVIATVVAQRQREIALRMALGAQRRQVLGEVMGWGARLTLAALALGVPLAAAVLQGMSATLLDLVEPSAALIALFAALVAAVALLATLLPARRATRIDPAQALRGD